MAAARRPTVARRIVAKRPAYPPQRTAARASAVRAAIAAPNRANSSSVEDVLAPALAFRVGLAALAGMPTVAIAAVAVAVGRPRALPATLMERSRRLSARRC